MVEKYFKKYENRVSSRDKESGLIEAKKRRECIPDIDRKLKELLAELYGIQVFITQETGSIAKNMCNEYSDIDLELLIPKNSKTINTIDFTRELNDRLDIPYNVHVFPIYVGNEYFE